MSFCKAKYIFLTKIIKINSKNTDGMLLANHIPYFVIKILKITMKIKNEIIYIILFFMSFCLYPLLMYRNRRDENDEKQIKHMNSNYNKKGQH